MAEQIDLDYLKCRNLPDMFFTKCAQMGDGEFLWRKTGGKFHSWGWARVRGEILQMASALRALGVNPGDRVLLVSENRPEWLIADFAIMTAGAITVPGYITYTTDDFQFVLSDSGAKAVIVSTAALAEKILKSTSQGQKPVTIMMDAVPPGLPAYGWIEALNLGAQYPIDLNVALDSIHRADTACIIYTSGTGGVPKGVMQSHGSLLHNARGARDLLHSFGLDDEIFLSFLPLSHAYEHTAGQIFPVSIGAQIYYCDSADKLAGYISEVRPTIMTAVPRLYETLYGRVMAGLKRQRGWQQWLFNLALDYGRRKYLGNQPLSKIESWIDRVLDILVRRKVRARFGGRLKAFVSGGAPLNYEIGLFFTALGMTILQGYGQTETAPIVSCNAPQSNKLDTVGAPISATEVRIANDGEILVRGELVMKGYWNNPDATREILRPIDFKTGESNGVGGAAIARAGNHDLWVHTGDIGIIDDHGRIKITDRKKDIIVLSRGDTLSPQRIEGFLNLEPEIGQSAVFGDKQAYVAAIIVPDGEWRRGKTDDDVKSAIDSAIGRVNKKLGINERVRRFAVINDGFTIDNGMMTPSMKIRRHKIKQNYADIIGALYQS